MRNKGFRGETIKMRCVYCGVTLEKIYFFVQTMQGPVIHGTAFTLPKVIANYGPLCRTCLNEIEEDLAKRRKYQLKRGANRYEE